MYNKYLKYLTFLFLLPILNGCSEDSSESVSLIVQDFTTVLSTPPSTGTVLGQIPVTTNQGELEFDLLSEDPAGALSIHPSSGEISVANASLFDFDLRTEITAQVIVTAGSKTETAEIIIQLSKLTAFDQEVIDYFKEIALGFEFGNASRITRRWESDVNIFVGGSPTQEHLTEVQKIIDELNALITTGISLQVVSTQSASNYFIYFGSGANYAQLYPSSAGLVESNWGLFSIFWNGFNQFTGGHMYVDIFRASEVEQMHLLREELTQSLGLARDSDKYNNSIFQQSFTTKTTEYAPIDKELIRLLYHPEMQIGLNKTTVEPVLISILSSEK